METANGALVSRHLGGNRPDVLSGTTKLFDRCFIGIIGLQHLGVEAEGVEGPVGAVGIEEAGQEDRGEGAAGVEPPAGRSRDAARPNGPVDQPQGQDRGAEHEQAVHVHPQDLQRGEDPGEARPLVEAAEDREEDGEEQQGGGFGADGKALGGQEQGGQPAEEDGGERRTGRPAGEGNEHRGRRDPRGQEDHPRDAPRPVDQGEKDLEEPVEVHPAAIRGGEGERVEVGHLAVSPDPLAGAEVPPDIVVPQFVAGEQEGDCAEEQHEQPPRPGACGADYREKTEGHNLKPGAVFRGPACSCRAIPRIVSRQARGVSPLIAPVVAGNPTALGRGLFGSLLRTRHEQNAFPLVAASVRHHGPRPWHPTGRRFGSRLL